MNVCSSNKSKRKLIWIRRPQRLLKESWKKFDRDQLLIQVKRSCLLNILEQVITKRDNYFKAIKLKLEGNLRRLIKAQVKK